MGSCSSKESTKVEKMPDAKANGTSNGHTVVPATQTTTTYDDMVLTDFQKKKLGYIYQVFYDVNNDGKVDWEDFKCALDKISELNNWDGENPKRKQAEKCLDDVWKGLLAYADDNEDKEISKDEWFKMWTDCHDKVVAKEKFPDWLDSYMNFMFDAADTSGDNVIDKDEFRLAYTSFGLSAEQCDAAFDKFSDNGSIALTKETYCKLWHEFFLSNDPNAKGNYLFGTAIDK